MRVNAITAQDGSSVAGQTRRRARMKRGYSPLRC